MRFLNTMLSLLVVTSTFYNGLAVARDAPHAKVELDEKAMMASMMKMGAPGPEHKMLQEAVGTWKVVTKWWATPDAEPSISEGISHITSVLGGRFISEDVKSDMSGTKFEGMGLTGFSNTSKKFVAGWADSMGTGIMLSEGTYDAATKTYTYSWSFTDPMDKKNKTMKMSIRVIDRDKSIHEFWTEVDNKAVKTMELTYTRVK